MLFLNVRQHLSNLSSSSSVQGVAAVWLMLWVVFLLAGFLHLAASIFVL